MLLPHHTTVIKLIAHAKNWPKRTWIALHTNVWEWETNQCLRSFLFIPEEAQDVGESNAMAFHSKEKSENRFFSFPDISRHFPTLPTFPDCRDLSGQVGTARGGDLIEQSQQERRNNCSTENWATAPHLVVPFWQIMPQMKAQHFFSALWPLPPARYHRSLLPYAILANSNDFLSRKRQKTSFLAYFGPFLPKFGPQHFFSKIGLRHFSPLHRP